MADWLSSEIIEKIQWNERLFSLRIRSEFKNFIAGQFVRVALDIQGERVARPYSLVNEPGDEFLEIYFNIVPEGPLSPALAALDVGDGIFVTDRANGFLTIDEVPGCRHLWLLATGTGVGPFLSTLKGDKVWQRFEKIVLGYSVRDVSELSYREQIAEIENRHGEQFCFVPFVTREKLDGAMEQRIPVCIENGSFEERAGIDINTEDSHVMMCGNSAMITSVTECLEARGLRKHRRREPGHITTEKYH
ncbi:MAG TPA: ferredoxin--NADP reductase [Gammaproteobacteria bacterium]|nr:ferredoxin--NADP reductase [Gammaproteobacteria bacterium]